MQQQLPWISLAVVAIVVLAAWLLWRLAAQRRQSAEPQPLPVEWDLLPRPVFTADERRIYRQLREALPHHILLAKLPLVRFCQPSGIDEVRFWYDLLGATHVTFAVCSANGRVLAAIDLNYDSGGLPSRATRIKQSVLGACRVRYLRCAPDHIPSIPELQLLVPHSVNASRGPQAASAADMSRAGGATPAASNSRRRERTALWQDSMAFSDSFFSPADRVFEAPGLAELPAALDAAEALSRSRIRPAMGHDDDTTPNPADGPPSSALRH